MKILVSRTDRAGDFILTLPVFRELKRQYPEAKIYAHLRRYTAPLAKFCPEIDSLIIDDEYPSGALSLPLVKKLKRENFTHIVVVHPSPRAILSAYLAKIPQRIGRASNIYMGFLNKRHIQKRSKNVKHEYQYNLELIEGLVDNILDEPYSAKKHFKVEGVSKISRAVVIHPGSGGSAYNISIEKYVQLAKNLTDHGIRVVVSLGPAEESIRGAFEEEVKTNLEFLVNVPDLYELGREFSKYKVFIGGSTGPLHLAALLGLYTVAFFPPVKAMVPERWGPRGNESFVVQPDLLLCVGKCDSCEFYPCMEKLELEKVVDKIIEKLGRFT